MVPANHQLLAAARRHAPAAWDTLLKQCQLPLYTYAAELLRDEAAALDVVQETFAAAVRHIGSLRDDRKFTSWLFGIAHQKCVQHGRRRRRDEALFVEPGDEGSGELPEAEGIDPRLALLRREHADAVFALVGQLPEAQRSALLLHVLEDFSLEDIAEITGVPLGTVKSRLHHAKRALRVLVETRFVP